MVTRIILGFSILCFIFQLFFSIYYSTNIIFQNNSLQQNTFRYSELLLENQKLEKELAKAQSLENLIENSKSKNLAPVNDVIDLRKSEN